MHRPYSEGHETVSIMRFVKKITENFGQKSFLQDVQ